MSERKRLRIDPRRFVYYTLMWSRALVPVIALMTAFASAVRTYQTTKEIYLSGGTEPGLATLVSLAMTIGVEGAIFGLALAQEWQSIKWRQSRKRRRVFSLKTVTNFVNERLGRTEPLSYDQLPERGNLLNLVLYIAFGYALVSNFNIGVRPLIEKTSGTASFQTFISTLVNAQASVQIQFFVDLVSMMFPPFMATVAGHLTARYASEVTASLNRSQAPRVERPKGEVEQRSKGVKLNAHDKVVLHLIDHPEDMQLSQAKLASKLNVSVGTVNSVIKEARSIEHSPNGNRRHE